MSAPPVVINTPPAAPASTLPNRSSRTLDGKSDVSYPYSPLDGAEGLSVQVASMQSVGYQGGGERELIPEIIQASLTQLGHNANGQIVYTTCNLSSLSLSNIAALAPYIHLQKVILDSNFVASLSALSGCSSLVHVSAANNSLTSQVFKDLIRSSNTLEYLDVSNNQLFDLNGLAGFRYLRTLKVAGNSLTKIVASDFATLKSLSVLVVSGNNITQIEANAFTPCPIRSLNASQNGLSDLAPFLTLKETLSMLSVASNNIMHFDALSVMSRLHTLDLAGNNAYDIAEVYSLAKLPLLRTVSLANNPLCSIHESSKVSNDDDDAASDIVQPDEPSVGAGGGGDDAAVILSRRSIAADDLRAREISRSRRQQASLSSAQMYASPDDDLAALTPQEEDKIQFLTADVNAQYRLRVLWRAPNITELDGMNVSAEELSHAKKLEGGATREARAAARAKFITSGGSVAFALRQQNRHRDAPNM